MSKRYLISAGTAAPGMTEWTLGLRPPVVFAGRGEVHERELDDETARALRVDGYELAPVLAEEPAPSPGLPGPIGESENHVDPALAETTQLQDAVLRSLEDPAALGEAPAVVTVPSATSDLGPPRRKKE